jgi:hypothetical protein
MLILSTHGCVCTMVTSGAASKIIIRAWPLKTSEGNSPVSISGEASHIKF